MMTPSTIRQFWRTVDSLDWSRIPRQENDEILPLLLAACQRQPAFEQTELHTLASYITQRLPLIREIAASY